MGQETPLLTSTPAYKRDKRWTAALWFLISLAAITSIYLTLGGDSGKVQGVDASKTAKRVQVSDEVESWDAVVAADDARCSEIGASVLKEGGHAVDAAVACTLCLGVVNPMASGIGGGGFMVVRSAATSKTQAFDLRETAPLAASQNMYENNLDAKYTGALSMGVPGELAGLHEAWLKHGRLPWKRLFQPAIGLAKNGFVVAPYLAKSISENADKINNDPGLRQVFAPNGKLLRAGETCHNPKLGWSLETVAEDGPEAFYGGVVGEKLVNDVRNAGGILTVDDLRGYQVEVTDAVEVNTMGFTIFGMPSPSSGTLGLALVLNVLKGYENTNGTKGLLSLHRFIEASKHMFALRMNLGDPDFVDISNTVSDMLSPSFAKSIQEQIFDNTTFPSRYYMPRWSQLLDHGTSHFCIVDADRNAVSMTTTVNYAFGGGVLSPSTGIVLNNEMGDFAVPTEISVDMLPPSPANFIRPNKRPLSSMTPIIVLKGDQLAGVIGGSGGLYIIPAVVQVFINHFILGMEPLDAVQSPRVYPKLIPNVVYYENWTVIDGDHIELPDDRIQFLKEKGHELESKSGGAICQLIVQMLKKPTKNRRIYHNRGQVLRGKLTGVSDPRKDGKPAAG